MALQEFYNTGDDTYATIVGDNWYGQTWTTVSAYNITSVKLKLYRAASSPDNVIVSIRATSGGLPTGSDLTSGSIAGSTLTEGSPGSFIEIPVTPYALTDATQYAIVLRVDTLSCSWRVDNSSPTYAGGNGCNSGNAGVNWSSGGWDSMFEIYGSTGNFSELSGTIAAVSTVTGNIVLGTTVELAGTIAVTATVTGNLVLSTVSELSGTIAAQSTVGPSSLGSTTVDITTKTSYIKRLVAAGNNQIWYEDI